MRWTVPASWTWTSMGCISQVIGGSTPSTADENNFATDGAPWITPADLTNYSATYISRGRRGLSEKGLRSCAARMMPKGTVLFSSRAPIGYCAIASNAISTNQGFKNFVLKGGISSEYVRHYLLLSVDYVESKASGTTFKELSGSRAAELLIPIAPLPEQQRITDKIGSLSAKSRRARERLDHIPRLAEKYKQALSGSAFQGALTKGWRISQNSEDSLSGVLDDILAARRIQWEENSRAPFKPYPPLKHSEWMFDIPKGWRWMAAEEIVEPGNEIVYGIVQPGPKLAKGIPYVRGTDIENGRIKFDQLLYTSEDIAKRYARASLRAGDVLLGIIRATKVAIVPEALTGANITQGTARFRPSRAIQTLYLARWLESTYAQNWLHSKYRGIDMPGLNLRDVRRLPVPVAPLREQIKIAALLEKSFSWIDRLASESNGARKLIDHFDQAVLSKAFSGGLVPQDESDEPASALLERIKAERNASPSVKRGHKRSKVSA